MKKWIVNGDVFETAEEVAQFIIDEADMSEECEYSGNDLLCI